MLSNLDLNAFVQGNYFLRLDYENESIKTNLASILKPPKSYVETLKKITTNLMKSRKFTDKCILLLAYVKKMLME